MGKVRIAVGIEYDGSRFCGWQTQPEGCSVQDTVERALREIAGGPVATICAGRTDAGVHALGQVIHFDTEARRPMSAWVRGSNALLPPSCAATWACEVSGDFHARYAALSRTYRYLLLNHPVRPAAAHGREGWFHLALELDRMREAAVFLMGEHDFSSFRSAECQARSPVRRVTRLDVARSGNHVVFEIQANAFLHHMVRNIVGCLIYVGKGKHPPQWIGELLSCRDRTRAAPTFDAAGLYLANVEYERRWGLPVQSRAMPAELGRSPQEVGLES